MTHPTSVTRPSLNHHRHSLFTIRRTKRLESHFWDLIHTRTGKMSLSACARTSSLWRTIPLQTCRATLSRGLPITTPYNRFINTKSAYEGHIPLNWFENAFLAAGSAVMSLVDPRRGGEPCRTLMFEFTSYTSD